MASNVAARLLKRLRLAGLDIPEGARAVRSFANRITLAEGAWSWHLVDAQGVELPIGSPMSMRSLLGERLVITHTPEGTTVVTAATPEDIAREKKPRPLRHSPKGVTGAQTWEIMLEDAPDVPPEESAITQTFRPDTAKLHYVRQGFGAWELVKIQISGRPVNKATGDTTFGNMRTRTAMYTDLTGKGGVQRAKTPKWVVDLAAQYADPHAVTQR